MAKSARRESGSVREKLRGRQEARRAPGRLPTSQLSKPMPRDGRRATESPGARASESRPEPRLRVPTLWLSPRQPRLLECAGDRRSGRLRPGPGRPPPRGLPASPYITHEAMGTNPLRDVGSANISAMCVAFSAAARFLCCAEAFEFGAVSPDHFYLCCLCWTVGAFSFPSFSSFFLLHMDYPVFPTCVEEAAFPHYVFLAPLSKIS